MEKINSYFGMAENDYKYAKASLPIEEQIGNYNGVAAICAQSGEKFLKAIIERCFSKEELGEEYISLLRTHNLRTLYNTILQKFSLNVSSMECKWLGDFYFDARYPGDNFVLVNKEDALQCIEIVEKLKEDVERILQKDKEEKAQAKEILQGLKAFEK